MAYTKTNWVNGSAPALSAENLNKIEDGIYANDANITSILASLTTPIQVKVFTTPSASYSSGNNWVYGKDWHADAIPGYTPIGTLQGTPNSGAAGLVCGISINREVNGDRFIGTVHNTTGSAITGTLQVPVLYIRNELL